MIKASVKKEKRYEKRKCIEKLKQNWGRSPQQENAAQDASHFGRIEWMCGCLAATFSGR